MEKKQIELVFFSNAASHAQTSQLLILILMTYLANKLLAVIFVKIFVSL